ncbi:MAG: COG1361 family protein [Thermoplasmataceae archaeon]
MITCNSYPANNGKVTIGNGVTRTTYYLFQNLTVMPGAKLVVNNTNLVFVGTVGSVMNIRDYGSAWINNSAISTSTVTGAGNITLNMDIGNGSITGTSSLFACNSTFNFSGSMNIVNSTIRFVSSRIGMQNTSSPSLAKSLSIKAVNSSIYSYNTSYDGLYHRSIVNSFANGYMNASASGSTGSFGEAGYNIITFTDGNTAVPTAYDDSILLNMTFSGNDSSGLDFINVMADGATIENYTFPSTGGGSILESVSVPVNVTVPISQAKAYTSSGFTAGYGLNAHTTIEIKRVGITLLSNDTEALYGQAAFNVLLHNSTFLSVKDNIPLGFQRTFTTGKILDPEKNMLILDGNSTAYLVSDEYGNGSYADSPFQVSKHSTVAIYRYDQLFFHTPGGLFLNGTPTVMPAMISTQLSAIADRWNHDLSGLLNESGFSFQSLQAGRFVLPLADSLINSSYNLLYLGDYSVEMAGTTSYFSVVPFPAAAETIGIDNFNLDLPDIFLSLNTPAVTVGNSSLNLTISSTGTVSLRNITLDIGGFTEVTRLLDSHGLTLAARMPIVLAGAYSIPASAQPGIYIASVAVMCSNYTLEGKNFSVGLPVTVKPSIRISVSNFSASASGTEIDASFIVSNMGLNEASYVLHARMTEYGGSNYTLTRPLAISPGAEYPVSLTFNTTKNITTFSLAFSPETNGSRSYNFTFNQSVTIKVTGTHVVTFTQNGLPRYTVWSVSVENTTYMGFGKSQNVSLPEGNYTAIITPYNGNFSIQTVNFSVSHKNSTVMVMFLSPKIKPPVPAYNIGLVYDAGGIGSISLASYGIFQWRSLGTYYVCKSCMQSYRKRLLHWHRHA